MTSKRKPFLAIAGLATAGLMFAACGTTGGTTTQPGASAGTSQAACDLEIAFLGPQTGPNANLGLNESRGAEVALDKYNKENANCQVKLSKFDSQGDPTKATPLATQIIGNAKVVGVVGPAFSGETAATGPAFSEAGLTTISPSATRVDLSSNGWKTFHRVLGNDGTQAPAAAKYITDTAKATTPFVIDDASDYGEGLATGIKEALGDKVKGTDTVQTGQTDFSATVTKVKAASADLVYYAGYYSEAGLLVKQLKAGGWTGTFMSGDGTLDKGFVTSAGASAANGSVLTCPCAPAESSFATEYKAVTNEDPGTYSGEAYDAMNVFLAGIKAGNSTREAMLTFVGSYDAAGITKQIKFDDKGEVVGGTVYAYTVTDGNLNTAAPIE